MLDIFKDYENLRFVKLQPKSKRPYENQWQDKPYTFSEIKEHISRGNNYGVMGGYGDLIIIDADKVTSNSDKNKLYPELDDKLSNTIIKNLPETLTVKSGSGAKHFYFFCPDIKKKLILKSKYKEDSVHWGEILSLGNQAVGPGSIHPETNNKYEIISTKPIATIELSHIASYLSEFIPFMNEEKEKLPESHNLYESIDDLKVSDIWGTSGLKFHNGEYSGVHPAHGSSTGINFWLNPSKNTWNCFRCNSGGGPAKAIAVKHGIISCGEQLYGDKFVDTLKIAEKHYGLKKKEYLSSDLNKNTTKRELQPLSFNEFMSKIDNKVYYVKRMFGSGTINMIFSPPKQMKTFVSYYLALCLAQGRDFLNLKTKRVKIGYFDWENPISDIQSRVKGICEGMHFDESDMGNFFFFPRQPTFMRVERYDSYVYEDLREQLITFVKDNDLKVIFFDTFRRLGNFDENDSRTINTIKSELFDPLIKETNVCIIFLHHTSKEGATYRGSVDIEGILDTSFKVTKRETDGNLKVNISCAARRNNEIDKLAANVDIESRSYEDEDGDMYETIDSVVFSRTSEESDETEGDYSGYRDFLINNLECGQKYRNKTLSEMLYEKFKIGSPVTINKIIKWATYSASPRILLKTGSQKNTRYELNPELNPLTDEVDMSNISTTIEEYLLDKFSTIDQIKISELVKDPEKGWDGLFSMKNVSLVIDKWNKKGWLNTAKAGYLTVTELYRGENNVN